MTAKILFFTIVAFVVAFSTSLALATDQPSTTCTTNGTFDKDKCSQKAMWIAVGTVADVQILSYPQDLSVTQFTLQIKEWEKKEHWLMNKKEIKYLHCHSGRCLQPLQSGNLVRVYGGKTVKNRPDHRYFPYYVETLNAEK